jgi:hypothetical protein
MRSLRIRIDPEELATECGLLFFDIIVEGFFFLRQKFSSTDFVNFYTGQLFQSGFEIFFDKKSDKKTMNTGTTSNLSRTVEERVELL